MGTGTAPLDILSELNRLESLRQPTAQGQRQYRRYPIRGDAELHPVDASRVDRTPIDVKLRDISRGGIGFVSERPLAVGSNWRCCFLHSGHVVAQQALIVRHCREVKPGLYLIGGQFCLELGVMTMLGVPASHAGDGELAQYGTDVDDFLSPGDVETDHSD